MKEFADDHFNSNKNGRKLSKQVENTVGKGEMARYNPFPNKPWFLRVYSTSILKTLLEKEKLLLMSNFSFSLSVFHPFRELSAIFIKFDTVVCKLSQFGTV